MRKPGSADTQHLSLEGRGGIRGRVPADCEDVARTIRPTTADSGRGALLRITRSAGVSGRRWFARVSELAGGKPSGRIVSYSKRAFLFDMDGVIVDSNPQHRLAWEAFTRSYGLETTEAMHERMYGRRNDQIVRDFFGAGLSAEEVEARGAAKEALYRKMIAGKVEGMLVPGLRDFLNHYR